MVLPHTGSPKKGHEAQDEEELEGSWVLGVRRSESRIWIREAEQLIEAISSLISRQRPHLIKGTTIRKAERVKKTGQENKKFLANKPQYLKKDLKSGFIRVNTDYYRPLELIDTKPKKNDDTVEYRLLKEMLIRIRQKICLLKGSVRRQEKGDDSDLLKELDRLEGRLSLCFNMNQELTSSPERMVQISMQQLSQLSAIYQDIYRSYLGIIKNRVIPGA